MEKILVIQVHRLGDVIQSTPALEALRRSRPDAHIAVLARKCFAEPLLGNPHVDEVIEWDIDLVFEEMPRQDITVEEQCPAVAPIAEVLRRAQFDTVINLSNDTLSAMLVAAIKAPRVSGLRTIDDRSLQLCGDWIHYLFMASDTRTLNTFNLCDSMRGLAEAPLERGRLHLPVSAEARQFARRFLAEHGVGERDVLVGFQPGASIPVKRWAAERFAHLGDLLTRHHRIRVVLFGADGETPFVEVIRRNMKLEPITAIGKTTLPQLGALLSHCKLLVSNDTATVHIAAAVGTPTLVLSFGPTYSRETAPYDVGHYVMEPDMPCFPCQSNKACGHVQCGRNLRVTSVLAAVEMALGRKPLRAVSDAFGGVSLWRTAFDRQGFLELEPVLPMPLTLGDVLRAVYRRFWLTWMLDRREPTPTAEGIMADLMRFYTLEDTPKLVREIREQCRNFVALEQLTEAADYALTKLWTHLTGTSTHPPDGSTVRLAEAVGRIGEKILGSDDTVSMRPLTRFLAQKRYEIQSLPPIPQTNEQRLAYGRLTAGCRSIRGTLEAIVEELVSVPAES